VEIFANDQAGSFDLALIDYYKEETYIDVAVT
jgi:hypothetical protein